MSNCVRDPYEVLGLHRAASGEEIKLAFRRLAAQHHPDRNSNDPQAADRFKEVNAAYQILSDPQRRAAYDRYGSAAFAPGGAAPEPNFVDLDGIFGDILGAFGFRAADPADLRIHVEVTLEEAVLGCEKELGYECLDLCTRCGGNTGEPGTSFETCRVCAGRGRIRVQQPLFLLAGERPCNHCGGLGKLPAQRCGQCRGRGMMTRRRTVQIEVPPGIEHGSARTLGGAGSRTRPDQAPGDLTIVIDVAPHPVFQRNGNDLYSRCTVDFVCATLGGEREVATIDGGSAVLRVPPGTPHGSTLRLKGQGVPHRLRSGRGDLLIEVRVAIPTNLTPEARALLLELGPELGAGAAHEDVEEPRLVDKIRSFFEP